MDNSTPRLIFAILYGIVLGLIFRNVDLPMWSMITSIAILAIVGNVAFAQYLKYREEIND